jgi:hypothetical protein
MANNLLLSNASRRGSTAVDSELYYVPFSRKRAKSETAEKSSGKFASVAAYISDVSLLKAVQLSQ